MTGTLVQTFIPIVSDNYVSVVQGSQKKVEGIIEILYDITPQWQQLATFQMTGTGGIIGIFFFLLAALFYTSRRAEAIIARQHETNLELAATAARAEAESKEKSQFLANVSHELRTPLNAIIGFSEIMKNEVMGELGNSQYRDYIKDIHGSGVHLLSLINDILDYSKAEAGKLELEVAETDVTKLLKNCIRLVSPRAEGAGVNLVDDIAKEHVVRNVDPKKLKQVMLNLLSNAVKFTPQGGEVKVATWVNVVDDSLYVEVKDTGIGIAPKDISRAMAPFGQVDSALSRKYEGTGLGLPLTKKFVELMGGTFTIQSELNVGTTITFNLPKEPPAKALKKGSSGPSKAEG
jgi:two-component system cell cycle sensor histidine kinase PleC